jgi:glycerophosphoryl diester phosphodiesterase
MRLHRVVVGVSLLVSGCSGSNAGGHPTATPPLLLPSAPSANPFRIGRPLVIPHSGGDALFPENTLYAYEHSVALGGDVIDADVRLTADGVPIAFHDSTLERTTNGKGDVGAKSYAELATLDAGWGFTLDGNHPFRGMGMTIPTIDTLLHAFPDTLFTLDLKDLQTSAVQPLCDLLRSTGRTSDVYIGVDTSEQVELFRRSCPEVATSGTDAERKAARAARESNDTTFVSHQEVSQPEFIGSDGQVRVTAETLAFAHRNGTAVLTWVVDDPDQIKTLIAMGVDGIYTRRPDVMVDVLQQLGIEDG